MYSHCRDHNKDIRVDVSPVRVWRFVPIMDDSYRSSNRYPVVVVRHSRPIPAVGVGRRNSPMTLDWFVRMIGIISLYYLAMSRSASDSPHDVNNRYMYHVSQIIIRRKKRNLVHTHPFADIISMITRLVHYIKHGEVVDSYLPHSLILLSMSCCDPQYWSLQYPVP